jgi:hypothetical protein
MMRWTPGLTERGYKARRCSHLDNRVVGPGARVSAPHPEGTEA